MKQVLIQCGHCCGKGKIELTGEGLETLKAVSKVGKETTSVELARTMGTKTPAMCNRLAVLEEQGLLVSRRYGRKRFYKLAAKGTT
jgi:DNA-binding transcriptional ArsR family regulator